MATEDHAAVARNYPVRVEFVDRIWLPEFSEQQVRFILDALMPLGITDARELSTWLPTFGYRSADDWLRAMAEMLEPSS